MSMIITTAGQNAVAQALANNTAITVSEVGFGTEDRFPTGGETALTAEVERKPVLAQGTDGQKSFFDARLEAEDGPYVIYEVGLFDDEGTLLFIGRIEGFNKLVLSDQPVTLDARIHVLTSQFENVVVQIDTSFAFVPAHRQIHTDEGLAGGGDLGQDRVFTLDIGSITPEMATADMDPSADRMAIWDADDGGNPVQKAISPSELGKRIGASSVSMTGPDLVFPDSSNTYTITDFDDFSVYTVSSDTGTVSRTDETITLDIGAGETASGLTLTVARDGAEVDVAIAIGSQSIAKPSITSPADAATDIGESPTLTTSAFQTFPGGADTHASTDWQISTASDFATTTWEVLADTSNLESITVPSGVLSEGTQYYVRARHDGSSLAASPYSDAVSFTTEASFFDQDQVVAQWSLPTGNTYVGFVYTGSNFAAAIFNNKVMLFNEFDLSFVSDFSIAEDAPRGLAWDGVNFYTSHENISGGGKIYKRDGSGTIIDTLTVAYSNEVGAITFDGTNLISYSPDTDRIYIHDGKTEATTSNFPAPTSNGSISGLSVYNGDLYSCDVSFDKIYKHVGISSTIDYSFASPDSGPRGLTFKNGTLFSLSKPISVNGGFVYQHGEA